MHQLLLLRHAKSSWDDPELPDHARPLNPRGHAAAAAIRRAMTGLGLSPDFVLVSSARRTRETLEALEPWEETPIVEVTDRLYNASQAGVLALIREVAPTVRSLLVVGHNPAMHELAVSLVGEPALSSDGSATTRRLAEAFPAGALAEFSLAKPWPELGPGGGRLVRFLCPKDLPEMAR